MANENNNFFNKVSSVVNLTKDVANNTNDRATTSNNSAIAQGYRYNRSWGNSSGILSTRLNAILSCIGNSEKDIWYGGAAFTLKKHLVSMIKFARNIEQNIAYLTEAVNLKSGVQSALDAYAYEDANYRSLVSQANSGAEISRLELSRASERRSSAWDALNRAASNLNETLRKIKSVSFESVTKNNNELDLYKINITEVTNEIYGKLNSVISFLETVKSDLNKTIYNNDTLTSKIGIIAPRKVYIGNARDNIIRSVEKLQTRIEQVNNRINEHIENITAFENNETVEVRNGEVSTVQNTVTEEKEVNETYKVKSGDTLIGIASKYEGVTWQSIYEANKNNPNVMPNGDYKQLVIGASLIIPGVTQTVTQTTTSVNDEVVDTVVSEKLPQIETFELAELVDYNKLSQTNWNVEALSMAAGEYSAPMAVNSEGKMIDKGVPEKGIKPSLITISSNMVLRGDGYHEGTDYIGGDYDYGTPIKSIGPGIVIATGYENDNIDYDEDAGNYVKILHETVDENGNVGYITSSYFHFKDVNVEVGDVVTENTQIGTMGNSGNVRGDKNSAYPGTHLHLELSNLPETVKAENGKTVNQTFAEKIKGKDSSEVLNVVKEYELNDPYNRSENTVIDSGKYYKDKGLI